MVYNYIKSLLEIDERKTSWKIVFLMMIFAYVFSIAMRMIWVLQVQDRASFQYNNEIMINTNDGYFYAQGAKDILDGDKLYPQSPIESMTSKLTAFFAKVLPFSFESLILYLPAFLGSLLVIPVILIGRSLNIAYVGFSAALIASIAWSYYNRTMIGYYDTDMLNIVLPTLVASLVIFAIHEKKFWILALFPIVMMFYSSWYNASFFYTPLLLSTLFYILVFERKNLYNYQMLSVYMISMSSLGFYTIMIVSMAMIAFFYAIERIKDKAIQEKIIYAIFFISFVLALMGGGFESIYYQLEQYVFRKAISDDSLSLVFFNVVSTVREAGQIPFEMFANRISGGIFLLYTSSIGVILLMIRYPITIILAPMMAVGFVALWGGLRFTVYAVPVNALGMAFVIFLVATYIRKYLLHSLSKAPQKIIYVIVIFALLSVNLNTHIQHIKNYMVPTVFTNQEVKLLDTLRAKVDKNDYIISWWDYGYPIRYYGQTQTLIDGGAHSGDINFPVSFALLKPMIPSANMLRLTVEAQEKRLKNPTANNNTVNIMKEYGFKNANEFIRAIDNKNFKLPAKTRDIYLYLPLRLLSIFPTVMLFSNLDISTGKKYPQPLFLSSNINSKSDTQINLSQGVKVFIKNGQITGELEIGGKRYPIKYFIKTSYNNTKILKKAGKEFNKSSSIYLIYMQDYGKFLILDTQSFYSTFVQMFVLEEYDKDLYEPIALDPNVKVYKLKK